VPFIFEVGIHNFNAQYSGDANNLGSQSSAISEVFTGPRILHVQGSTGNLTRETPLTINLQ
jgi:hypothetical protein